MYFRVLLGEGCLIHLSVFAAYLVGLIIGIVRCFSYRATSNHRQKHAGDPSGTGACRQSLPSVKPSGEGFVPTKAAAL